MKNGVQSISRYFFIACLVVTVFSTGVFSSQEQQHSMGCTYDVVRNHIPSSIDDHVALYLYALKMQSPQVVSELGELLMTRPRQVPLAYSLFHRTRSESLIHTAVRQKKNHAVKFLATYLPKKVLDSQGLQHNRPLHLAIQSGIDVEIIRALLDLGAPLVSTNSYGRTPLDESVGCNRPEYIAVLIGYGVPSDVYDKAFDLALSMRRADSILAFIKAGTTHRAKDVQKVVNVLDVTRRVSDKDKQFFCAVLSGIEPYLDSASSIDDAIIFSLCQGAQRIMFYNRHDSQWLSTSQGKLCNRYDDRLRSLLEQATVYVNCYSSSDDGNHGENWDLAENLSDDEGSQSSFSMV